MSWCQNQAHSQRFSPLRFSYLGAKEEAILRTGKNGLALQYNGGGESVNTVIIAESGEGELLDACYSEAGIFSACGYRDGSHDPEFAVYLFDSETLSPIDTQYFTASTSQARAIACADDFIYATGWAANGADIEVLTVKLERGRPRLFEHLGHHHRSPR